MAKHPVIIFYERHENAIPKLLMMKLLPELKKIGVGAFAVEDAANDTELKEMCLDLNQQISFLKENIEKIKSLSPDSSKPITQELGHILHDTMYDNIMKKSWKYDIQYQYEMLPKIVQQMELNVISMESFLSLLDVYEGNNIKPFGMDAVDDDPLFSPSSTEGLETRNNTMVQKILEKVNDTGVVVLVGAAHCSIGLEIKEKGTVVKEYFFDDGGDDIAAEVFSVRPDLKSSWVQTNTTKFLLDKDTELDIYSALIDLRKLPVDHISIHETASDTGLTGESQ